MQLCSVPSQDHHILRVTMRMSGIKTLHLSQVNLPLLMAVSKKRHLRNTGSLLARDSWPQKLHVKCTSSCGFIDSRLGQFGQQAIAIFNVTFHRPAKLGYFLQMPTVSARWAAILQSCGSLPIWRGQVLMILLLVNLNEYETLWFYIQCIHSKFEVDLTLSPMSTSSNLIQSKL